MGKLMLNNINYTGGSGGTNVVPNPPETATDDLTSIKIDNTVYNLAGGDVTDVEVNGESVLDANHVAQIKSYKTLTQAEYDALPSSKLTDNVLYCITDAGIVEEQQFAPVIYSLEERQIGTWIDGKPLYQKTFMFNELTNIPSNNWFDTGFTLNNCLICGEATAFYMDSSAGSSYAITASIDVGINQPIYLLNYRSAIIATHGFTIQYTKITDIPGSGDWTTSGIPTVHYTTDEQVVGTYLGETLYEKTFTNLILSTSGQTFGGYYAVINATNLVPNATNIKFIRGDYEVANTRRDWLNGMYEPDYNTFYLITTAPRSNVISNLTIQYTKSSS